MQVLLVNGSSRQNGCTNEALREVARALEEEGIGTELFFIGNEAILCNALALPPPQEVLVLYHCRVDKGVATVAVRSQSAAITQAVASAILDHDH